MLYEDFCTDIAFAFLQVAMRSFYARTLKLPFAVMPAAGMYVFQ